MAVQIKRRFYRDRNGEGISYGVIKDGKFKGEYFTIPTLRNFLKGLGLTEQNIVDLIGYWNNMDKKKMRGGCS